jgi:four helix bundle protein
MADLRDVTDIAAWQLAHKLNLRVDLFLLSPEFRRHYKHSDRLSDVVRSAPRNIAEGFSSDPNAFAERLRLAKGSQAEVLGHLADAYDQCLITFDEWQISEALTKRAIRAANGLIRSLESTGETRAGTRARRRSPPPRRRVPRGSD